MGKSAITKGQRNPLALTNLSMAKFRHLWKTSLTWLDNCQPIPSFPSMAYMTPLTTLDMHYFASVCTNWITSINATNFKPFNFRYNVEFLKATVRELRAELHGIESEKMTLTMELEEKKMFVSSNNNINTICSFTQTP